MRLRIENRASAVEKDEADRLRKLHGVKEELAKLKGEEER